jgi:hypothetical protein
LRDGFGGIFLPVRMDIGNFFYLHRVYGYDYGIASLVPVFLPRLAIGPISKKRNNTIALDSAKGASGQESGYGFSVGFRSRIGYKGNSLVMFGTRISVRSCSPSGLGLGKNLPPKQGIGMERFSPKWGQVWGAILYKKILHCRTYAGAHDVYDQGVQALWGSGSSAFVEQIHKCRELIDPICSFLIVWLRWTEIHNTVASTVHGNVANCCSKFMVL